MSFIIGGAVAVLIGMGLGYSSGGNKTYSI